jgi:hypothetical protein
MAKRVAQVKFLWQAEPPGRVGTWKQGRETGPLGAIWFKDVWWAAPHGHVQFQGGFPSAERAIKYVEENAQGVPEQVAVPDAPAEPSLEEILGGRDSQTWTRYWKTMACWPQDKNHAPKRTAQVWLEKCAKTDPKTIYIAAMNYRDLFLPPKRPLDESRFMKGPETWLRDEAYYSTGEEP